MLFGFEGSMLSEIFDLGAESVQNDPQIVYFDELGNDLIDCGFGGDFEEELVVISLFVVDENHG